MSEQLAEADAIRVHACMQVIRSELRDTDLVLALAALNVISAEMIARYVPPADQGQMVRNYAGQLTRNVKAVALVASGHGPQVVH